MVNGEKPLLRNSRRQRRVEGSDRRHKRRPIIPAISLTMGLILTQE